MVVQSFLLLGTLTTAAFSQVVTPPPRTTTQDTTKKTTIGKTFSGQQISDAIKKSGLSADQLRAKLLAGGYDPAMADDYFGKGVADSSKASFQSALMALGVLSEKSDTTKTPGDSTKAAKDKEKDKEKEMEPAVPPSRVFGKSIFSSRSTFFNPASTGPVDAAYRLGIGDQLQLVLTGEVEQYYQIDVRRDGTVIIPQIGQVSVAGLTLDGARGLLRDRGAAKYSGLSSGRVSLDLTVSRVHANQVFILGDVESPGAFEVSALSTVFYALSSAKGPTTRGSFRNIEVRRGDKLFKKVDLYDYLLSGDSRNDVRTEQGDVIFVPPSTRMVTVAGEVRRPAIFELKDGEGFADLLRFAAGLLPTASVQRVQINRILPARQRRPGVDRVVIDVPLVGAVSALDTVQLFDSDSITVFAIDKIVRNKITIMGGVNQPGEFEWRPGLQLSDLVRLSNGFTPWALTDRIKIRHPSLERGDYDVVSVDYVDPAAKSLLLREFDIVTVLDGRFQYPRVDMQVTGAVGVQGPIEWAQNMTLKDAIDYAGGLTEDAATIEVARRKVGSSYSDTSFTLITLPIEGRHKIGASGSFKLERGDMISVRASPGYPRNRTVAVTGLFAYRGQYTLQSDSERVRDVVRRAGGTLPPAFGPSFRLQRDKKAVAVDYSLMMKGDPQHNIVLIDGDTLQISSNPDLVTVEGAVYRPVSIPYRTGWSLSQYIDAAGGRTATAESHQAVVERASGEVDHVRRRGWFFFTSPQVGPGSIITVPVAPPQTENFTQGLTTVLQVTSSMLSLVIAYLAIKKG